MPPKPSRPPPEAGAGGQCGARGTGSHRSGVSATVALRGEVARAGLDTIAPPDSWCRGTSDFVEKFDDQGVCDRPGMTCKGGDCEKTLKSKRNHH